MLLLSWNVAGRLKRLPEQAVRVADAAPDIVCLQEVIDRAVPLWEHALAAPAWDGPPVWMHGDLMPTNLLIDGAGGLAAVVDWGSCTTGDPACEALLAWMSLDAGSRRTFRDLLGLDDATWARARGWALSCAVMALPYYRHTYPVLADVARRTFVEVLADDLE